MEELVVLAVRAICRRIHIRDLRIISGLRVFTVILTLTRDNTSSPTEIINGKLGCACCLLCVIAR